MPGTFCPTIGEINVSEKTVAKSCVAKLSVAKSTYTVPNTPFESSVTQLRQFFYNLCNSIIISNIQG